MRFLLDENLSPQLGHLLTSAGHDTVHVRDLGLASASDRVVMRHALEEERTVVSADTDFGQLLADSGSALPSVILFRREAGRAASVQAGLLLANLGQLEADLQEGAIVVLEATRIRVRRLPITPEVPPGP